MRTFAVLAVLLSVSTGALADAGRRCIRLKLEAAVDYARAFYECEAVAAETGQASAFACRQAAGATVEARVAAADALGPCPGTPFQVRNSICVPAIDSGDAACRAAKYRAAGWKFAKRLACHGKGLLHAEAPRTRCFERVESRFTRQIARADALGTCGGSASGLESLVDRCVLDIAKRLSCGNGRLDYGEICEGPEEFCNASACFPLFGACCVTSDGCFQFGTFIEECFFNGGLEVLPGFCTSSGCAEDIQISATRVCCQENDGGCSQDVAGTASELLSVATSCSPVGLAVVGTCGGDGRCVPASQAPVALTTTSTEPPPTSTSTTVVTGSTTSTTAFPFCNTFGSPCGSCGSGICLPPFDGAPIGGCFEPDPVGPCSPTPPPCGTDEACISPGGVGGCYALCF